ncbi:MAG: hypothetical protein HYZ52_02315 [Candidatus Omnitrophica bacterium]|nr:hypothetical protein [Candidatus Omnitrophota bacterium]
MNRKGTVFVTTMIAMLLMILAGDALYTMSDQGFYTVKRLKWTTQAKYLADLGLSTAFGYLYNTFTSNYSWSGNFVNYGSYSTTISTPVANRPLLSSTGTVQGVTANATSEVQAPGVSALDYLFAAGNEIELEITGGGSSASLVGNTYSSNGAEMEGNINHVGSDAQSPPVASFPTVDASFYQNIAVANNQYYSSSHTFNSGALSGLIPGGVVYVNGNATIYGTQTFTGCLVATGNITMAKTGSTPPRITITQSGNYPAMMTINGNITFSSNGSSGGGGLFVATGLIYSGNNVSFSQNQSVVTVTGSVLARDSIDMDFVSQTTMNMTYVAQSPPGMTISASSNMTILSYNT